MKKLSLIPNSAGHDRFPNDVYRIIRVCAAAGYSIDYPTACIVWYWYSDDVAAGWMTLPDTDQEIVDIVLSYVDVEEVE